MAQRDLIIDVDDIGMHEGAVAAAVETITHGVAASGSVMMVCPATRAALEPRRSFGVGDAPSPAR